MSLRETYFFLSNRKLQSHSHDTPLRKLTQRFQPLLRHLETHMRLTHNSKSKEIWKKQGEIVFSDKTLAISKLIHLDKLTGPLDGVICYY